MSKVNSRKDSFGRVDTDEDASAKHLPPSGSDMSVKSGHDSQKFLSKLSCPYVQVCRDDVRALKEDK